MPDLDTHARRIAEAASAAWWGAHGGNDIAIPLGVVAALALTRQADPAGPDPAKLVPTLDRDRLAELLHAIWLHFAIARPELCIRVGPFARWLEDNPNRRQLDGAQATALAVVKTGQLDLTGDRELTREVDLLGQVYQELRNPKAKKAHGEVYTPTVIADMMARRVLADVQPGQSVHDPCAGTGGLLRAAAQAARSQDIDPSTLRWYAADVDPVAVAALAVNAHIWGLGRLVVIGCADTLAEPDWDRRALAEQHQATKEHSVRVTIARSLALIGRAAAQTSADHEPNPPTAAEPSHYRSGVDDPAERRPLTS